jgi:hypothetical protein
MIKIMFKTITIAVIFLAAELMVNIVIPSSGSIINKAEAKIGRPLTPLSVAGVARRTTRRMVVRTSVYIAVLPVGCTTIIIDGISLRQCGNTYYQSYNNQYVVVNVN